MENKELIELVNTILDSREARVSAAYNPLTVPLRSEKLDKYRSALSKMQGEYISVAANKVNPHFKSKYADLDAVIASVRPLLAKNGFSLEQEQETDSNGTMYLRTTLAHTSDQYKSSLVLVKPDKPNIQGLGSALSYHKRYSVVTILGITVDSDPTDDDGEANYNREAQRQYRQPVSQKKETLLSANEIEFIRDNLKSDKNIEQALLKTLKKNRLEDCEKRLFDTIVMYIDASKKSLS